MERYEDILARADRHFRKVEAEQPAALHCRIGCTICCHGLFEISPSDVVVLAEGLRSLDEGVRRRLIAKSREILDRLVHPDLGSLSDHDRAAFFDGPAEDEPCPALSDTGACTIYEHRPLVCRTFGLPLREGSEYRGEACELNFTESSRAEMENAAWDLEWEDIVSRDESCTVPQAIVIAGRLLEQQSDEPDSAGLSIAEGAGERDHQG